MGKKDNVCPTCGQKIRKKIKEIDNTQQCPFSLFDEVELVEDIIAQAGDPTIYTWEQTIIKGTKGRVLSREEAVLKEKEQKKRYIKHVVVRFYVKLGKDNSEILVTFCNPDPKYNIQFNDYHKYFWDKIRKINTEK